MNEAHCMQMRKALTARGWSSDGTSPHDTMTLSDSFLESTDLSALFDLLVTRREKIGHFWRDDARTAYEDVVSAVEAVKEVSIS